MLLFGRVTVFFTVFDACYRVAAIPLSQPDSLSPSDTLTIDTHNLLFGSHTNKDYSISTEYARISTVVDSVASQEAQVAFHEEDEYAYPTVSSETSIRRTRHHSSTSRTMVENVAGTESVQRTTLFVPAAIASPSLSASVHHLSPLIPLSNGTRSALRPIHPSHKADIKVLPWILGILLLALMGAFVWIGILYYKRRPRAISSNSCTRRDSEDAYKKVDGLGVSASSERLMESNSYGNLTLPSESTIPEIPSQPFVLYSSEQPGQQVPGRLVPLTRDPFELKQAHFPTKGELGDYVFPPTATAVEREVLSFNRVDVIPVAPSMTSLPLFLQPPNAEQSTNEPATPHRLQGQKKRLSPIGDVLYSSDAPGEALETVEEEDKAASDRQSTFYNGAIIYSTGPKDEKVHLASSTSYYNLSQSPIRRRSRGKSSPVVPSFDFPSALDKLASKSKSTQSPIIGRMRSSSVGRQCSDAAAKFGQLISSATERISVKVNPSPKTSAAEEERKFREFVKGLVRCVQKRDAKKYGLATSPDEVDGQMESPLVEKEATVLYNSRGAVLYDSDDTVLYESRDTYDDDSGGYEVAKEAKMDSLRGLSILLPPLSFGAKLSDFTSADSLNSESPHASYPMLTIGVAI